jgi:hypothetical protein
MKWFDSARVHLRLLFARRAAESRMNDEFRFHLEMETERLMRMKGLAPDEARRQALAAFRRRGDTQGSDARRPWPGVACRHVTRCEAWRPDARQSTRF